MNTMQALRATVAATALAFSIAPVHAASPKAPESGRPPATAPTSPDHSEDGKQTDRPGCKKIYRTVHHGHPGKGTDTVKLVRIECPPRAA